ncbi:MAG: DUF3887 domain-containing protein [Actinobacteria bacterium]|nr:DUF3887 domain-containing protein [Actinomycetota bacterium]
METIGSQVVADLNQGRFGEVTERFDPNLKAALTEADLKSAWEATISEHGAFLHEVRSETQSAGQHEVVAVICQGGDNTFVVQLALNPAGQIGGLFFRPGPG